MPSFDSVNYGIRPNKIVERKIAFSGLTKLSRIIDLSKHQYVGLGSLWFIDFLMAHKVLGIESMVSIENTDIGFKRSKFNCPLSCIDVVHGETTLVIPKLKLETTPSIVWFDYDSSIGGPALEDIGMLAGRCAPNSIILVTINAKRDELPKKDEDDKPIEAEASLRRIAGDLVPTPLEAKSLNVKHYPKLLCQVLSNQLQNATVSSGRSETFIKLFDLVYSDGTPMITVGGIIATSDKANQIRDLIKSPGWEGFVSELIFVPPLTLKEKLFLDQMMPSASPLTCTEEKIGFPLKQEQLDIYQKFYRYYPMLAEIYY